jgi:hypothetical protein
MITFPNKLNRSAPLKPVATGVSRGYLPKLLLGAALLVGGAGSVLSAGTAKADPSRPPWTDIPASNIAPFTKCDFLSTSTNSCVIGITSPVVVDKQLTILNWSSISSPNPSNPSDLVFSYVPGDTHRWHVDLNFNPDDTDGGSLAYLIEIVPQFIYDRPIDPNFPVSVGACALYPGCGDRFGGVRLSSGAAVTKVYGTGYDATALDPRDGSTGLVTGIIDILNTPPSPDFGPGGPRALYVKDYWAAGQPVDNLENAFNQVPAPLPLLGVGAAFGSIRKLRKFSSQLKTFSMG